MISHSIQACCHLELPAVWRFCKSLQYQPLLSTPPPSNTGLSDPLYRAVGSTSRICPGVQDMAASLVTVLLFCCSQTGQHFCGLCLGPVLVHMHLRNTQRGKGEKYNSKSEGFKSNQKYSVTSNILTLPQTRFQPLKTTVVLAGRRKSKSDQTGVL